MLDYIKNGQVQLVVNTSFGKKTFSDAYHIRRATIFYNLPYATTIAGARAMAQAVAELRAGDWDVRAIQDYHREASSRERLSAVGTEPSRTNGS